MVMFNGNKTNNFNKSNTNETQIIASDWTIEKGSFDNFNLPENIIKKLAELKISYLYPIQCATLELIRKGQDIIAQASEQVQLNYKQYDFQIIYFQELGQEKH